MDVACSTFCFEDEPLDQALRRIAELEFTRVDLGVAADGTHMRPSDLVADLNGVLGRIRQGPTVSVAAVTLRMGPGDDESACVDAAAHLAKQMATALVTVEPSHQDLAAEVERLGLLQRVCSRHGVVLSVLTKQGTVASTPAGALALAAKVAGIGLSLDPSHLLVSGSGADDWEPLYPLVRHVYLRDTSNVHGQFQTSVGRGEIDYSKVVSALQRSQYRGALVVDFEQRFGGDVEPALEARKLGRVLESLL